MGDFYWDYWVQ